MQLPTFLSEEKVYRLLFDTAAEGLLLADEHGLILLANQRAEALFGYEPGELVGMSVDMLVPEVKRNTHAHQRKGYMEHPSQRSMGIGLDLAAARKDGSTFPVEISLNHTKAQGRQLVMALITDISKRKAAEEELAQLNIELEQRVVERTRELRESQRLYSLIARNFPNGTINVFDRELNYVFVEGRELFKQGVTSAQLVGTNYLERLDPLIEPFVRQHLERVFDGEDISFEVHSGDSIHEMHCVGLDSLSGQVHHILVVEHDITKLKQAEDDIRTSLQKERELNELKSRFVSMASHEFRTPLSTILTSLALVQRYESPDDKEKRLKHLARIKSSVHNLTGILNDFLSIEKLETGVVTPNPSELDLNALMADVVEDMQAIAKTGQRIEMKLEGESACFLDGSMLRNIFINLMHNAIKYSEEGMAIEVLAVNHDGTLRVDVTDHGIGIPEEEQGHLFEHFFRARNVTNIQGTGLGLIIVKKYLDLMGGEISFVSQESIGSTFSFVIPQNQEI